MKKYTIVTVVKIKGGHIWFDRMEEGIKRFAAETGHNAFLIGPPKAGENLQDALVGEMIDKGVDALCVVPYFPQALEMNLGKAKRRGIVVISHEASNQRNVDYNVEAFDNTEYGIHLMDHLAHYMGAEGKYAILLASLMAQSHSEWSKAALTRQRGHYPEMQLITRKIQSWEDITLAREKTLELLERYPDLRGILGISMTSTIGAGYAIDARGRQNDVVFVGTGLVSGCKAQLLSGATNLISFWDPADAGYAMNKLAVMVLQGDSIRSGVDLGAPGYHKMAVKGKTLIGSAMIDVTKENMSQFTL